MYLIRIPAIVFAVSFALMAMDAAAGDEVYRWVDKDGVVHFSDQPPSDAVAEPLVIPQPDSGDAALTTPAGDSENTEPQPSYAQQQRDERAARREETRERQRVIGEACAQRRQLVSQLEPSTRVMVQLEDGSVVRMDDNERLETLAEAKTYIAENCNK
jgi:hypothetical protein